MDKRTGKKRNHESTAVTRLLGHPRSSEPLNLNSLLTEQLFSLQHPIKIIPISQESWMYLLCPSISWTAILPCGVHHVCPRALLAFLSWPQKFFGSVPCTLVVWSQGLCALLRNQNAEDSGDLSKVTDLNTHQWVKTRFGTRSVWLPSKRALPCTLSSALHLWGHSHWGCGWRLGKQCCWGCQGPG